MQWWPCVPSADSDVGAPRQASPEAVEVLHQQSYRPATYTHHHPPSPSPSPSPPHHHHFSCSVPRGLQKLLEEAQVAEDDSSEEPGTEDKIFIK